MSFDPRPPHWLERFHDLPLLTVPSAQQPRYDGDLAPLHEMVDAILAQPIPQPLARKWADESRYMYHTWAATIDATGIMPHHILNNWPADDE